MQSDGRVNLNSAGQPAADFLNNRAARDRGAEIVTSKAIFAIKGIMRKVVVAHRRNQN